jgi:hypothetical protein
MLTMAAIRRHHERRYLCAYLQTSDLPMTKCNDFHCARRPLLDWRLCVGLLLIGCSATAQAASVALSVSATVLAVHCTTEQRARIRACATAEQQTDIAPYKTMVRGESRTGQTEGAGARQEILVDPSRQVMVKTLLY